MVLPSYSKEEPSPARLHCLPGMGGISPSLFRPQPAQPGALLNLDSQIPWGQLQQSNSIFYSLFPNPAFLPLCLHCQRCACAGQRERRGIWCLAMGNARVPAQTFWVGRGSYGWRSSPPLPVAQVQAGGLSLTLMKPKTVSRRQSPGSQALGSHVVTSTTRYLHHTEVLLFQMAFLSSLQWGEWDNTLG